MKIRCLTLIILLPAVCMFVFAGFVSAQSKVKPDGMSAVYYSDGKISGTFERSNGKTWKESNNSDGVHYFTEFQRDDWSVYMKDSRDITIQIDLWTDSIYVDPYGKGRRKIYSINEVKTTQSGLIIGRSYSFESNNFPGDYIRHASSLGIKSRIDSDLSRLDSTFRIVNGLAADTCAGTVSISFESVNYTGHYLRHQGYRIKLNKFENGDLFKSDATFCLQPGLANGNQISFQSSNYPNHYLSHTNGELWIREGNDKLFRQDSTFVVRSGLAQ
jgi:hypothetical protein